MRLPAMFTPSIYPLDSEKTENDFRLATEYCHHEGAVAYTYGLPLLTIAEQGLEPRLMFSQHAGLEIISVPLDADRSWLATKTFRGPFENWKQKLERRRDVFLGYCGSSTVFSALVGHDIAPR